MRRLAAGLALAAALAAGCGGTEQGSAPEPVPAPAAVPQSTETGPTAEQLAVREQLLAEIASGEYKCYCNAAMRARERIEKGLVKAPPRDAYVAAEP
jgi:hypothetical protein